MLFQLALTGCMGLTVSDAALVIVTPAYTVKRPRVTATADPGIKANGEYACEGHHHSVTDFSA